MWSSSLRTSLLIIIVALTTRLADGRRRCRYNVEDQPVVEKYTIPPKRLADTKICQRLIMELEYEAPSDAGGWWLPGPLQFLLKRPQVSELIYSATQGWLNNQNGHQEWSEWPRGHATLLVRAKQDVADQVFNETTWAMVATTGHAFPEKSFERLWEDEGEQWIGAVSHDERICADSFNRMGRTFGLHNMNEVGVCWGQPRQWRMSWNKSQRKLKLETSWFESRPAVQVVPAGCLSTMPQQEKLDPRFTVEPYWRGYSRRLGPRLHDSLMYAFGADADNPVEIIDTLYWWMRPYRARSLGGQRCPRGNLEVVVEPAVHPLGWQLRLQSDQNCNAAIPVDLAVPPWPRYPFAAEAGYELQGPWLRTMPMTATATNQSAEYRKNHAKIYRNARPRFQLATFSDITAFFNVVALAGLPAMMLYSRSVQFMVPEQPSQSRTTTTTTVPSREQVVAASVRKDRESPKST